MASELGEVQMLETGLFIDRVTGGIPKGRITEVWGDASIGKSTLCLQIIAAAQRQGLQCLWADVEYAYETRYAKELGVDNETLGFIQDKVAENIIDEIERAADSGDYGLIILDSIGGLASRQEHEKGSGEKVIGGQASLVSRFCRKIVPTLSMTNCALIVINHSFVDIMSGAVKTSGGAKLAYHKSLSIRLRAAGTWIKQGENIIGKVVTAEVTKDKVRGNEKAKTEGHLMFKTGFSKSHDLLEEAIRKEIITKKGQTYWMGEEKIGRISQLRERMKIDEEFTERLKALV